MANNQNRNTFPEWPWFVLAVLGVIVLFVLAIAAYRSVLRDNLPLLVSVVFQVIVTILGVVVAIVLAGAVSGYVGSRTWHMAAEMVSTVERNYDQRTLNKIKGRVPAAVTGTLLLGNGTLIYVDKAFGGDTLMVLAAALTCTLIFAVADWLMMSPRWGLRGLGWGIWGLTLLGVLIIVMGYYSWSPRYILGQLFHPLDLSSQLVSVVQTVPKPDIWKLTVIVMSTVLIVVLFLFLPLWTNYFAPRKDANNGEDL